MSPLSPPRAPRPPVVCPTEICAFSDRAAEFAAIGCDVVGASIDSKFSHLAWTQQTRANGGLGKMHIPLLADVTKQVSRDYGVLIETGGDAGVAARGTFIISPTGIVRCVMINDLPVGRSVDEVLRLVNAFKFTDEHGEVCPASWRKRGDATMVADPAGSKAFFSAAPPAAGAPPPSPGASGKRVRDSSN
jgi:alkyl hydroperoxide reductase subunit AhpC